MEIKLLMNQGAIENPKMKQSNKLIFLKAHILHSIIETVNILIKQFDVCGL